MKSQAIIAVLLLASGIVAGSRTPDTMPGGMMT